MSSMSSLPSEKLQAIVFVRNKHFKNRINLKTQGWKRVGHQCAAEGKEKKILRREVGRILGLEANITLASINTFYFFLLTAFPMSKVNHQQVPQLTGQNIWQSLEAHRHAHFFLIHSSKVAIPFLTFTSLK